MTFTTIEQEAIVLNAVIGMVDDMVNHAIWCIPSEKTEDTNLLPRTRDTMRQFAILLRDFLSPVTTREKKPMPFGLPQSPNGDKATDTTTLFYLARICENPLIGTEIEPLRTVVSDFMDWLEAMAFVEEVWLAHICIKVDLRIKRIDFIRMSGDIGKHNFLRLGGQVNKLRTILAENGVTIDESQAYMALPDLWDWFFDHLMSYHASTIAEFLNNLRHAIRCYVYPVAKDCYRVTGKIDDYADIYTYERPDGVVNEFAWEQYYDLLRGSMRKTNFPLFSVARSLKERY